MKTLLAAVALLAGSIPAASGQTFPSRTLTLVVPFSAGGPTDTIGRIVAQRMGAALGQTVVVENVTGAGGNDRRRPRRARGARRLHPRHRPSGDARHQRRDLRAPVRR